jgi:putative PIN family toxin of toxin-antitoxin system
MVRIVLDTNILVSGLLYPGKPRRLIESVINGRIEIVSSIEMIDELKEVLSREKFSLGKEEQGEMMDFVIRLSHITVLRSKFKAVKDDPDDDMVINTAYDGKAAYIVSGDKALSRLRQFGGIKIVNANGMLKLIEAGAV